MRRIVAPMPRRTTSGRPYPTPRSSARRPVRSRKPNAAKRAKGSYSGDLEFHVLNRGDDLKTFSKFDEAAGLAVAMSASDGRPATIDVVVWSRAGARKYGGDYAVERYLEDPEASVFDRITIRAESRGRIA